MELNVKELVARVTRYTAAHPLERDTWERAMAITGVLLGDDQGAIAEMQRWVDRIVALQGSNGYLSYDERVELTDSLNSFGNAFFTTTAELGLRVNSPLYINTFFDAGNVYRSARQWDPTRLFRGAGVGAAVISPLGPIGVDMGYGFDRVDGRGRPDPGWQLHFKLGNFF